MLKIINKYNSVTLSLILFSSIKIFSAAIITSAENNNSDILGDQLVIAAKDGNKKTVEELINAGANVNYVRKGSTALCESAFRGHVDIVKLLVNSRADVNLRDKIERTALMWAAKQGDSKIVEALINVKDNIESESSTYRRDFLNSIMDALDLVCEAIPDQLIISLLLGKLDIGRELLFSVKHGAQIKYFNVKEQVERLIEQGADVNTVDSNNSSPLMWAASHGYTEIVNLLINAGANTEIVNTKPGFTALFYGITSKAKAKEIVPLLLTAGSDITKKDIRGKSIEFWIDNMFAHHPANAGLIKYLKELLEQEPTRRETVTNKWSAIFAEKINKSSSVLILPILKIITSYSTEYNDIPIAFRFENIDIIKNN